MRKHKLAIIAVLGMFFLAAPAAALDLENGLYEMTSRVEMQGMAMPPSTITQCLTREDPVPAKSADGSNCKILDMTTDGNTVRWTMECNQQGQQMTSTGEMTYDGDRFEGTIETVMGPQAGNMTMTTQITGKRVGDCP